ncbi:chymotrypsin A-like [Hyla sarda]|uniref:chymotrypsin A-like n=1 Tax=Hyla sarda TaxID=327740 RepID=UPI0024C3DA85|nr:chymotrypsin A-like [Hyla sarda]XP_056412732.1 chymotrypsin A-like [Hyla sarda]XP_056412733.1 chymotrypsin A-like [Hyla sarda]XP_056412734.1 chymotrypsin A-like [Hyla sarda]XP_056412735.1 chymotrypsin A-like [Hyla sarda]XP_056412736.1 chymotrypsin A-like [Hyla sarda]XP_056412738.1 chymotrypsin A-like [Hyla sarda]XP_056412739.1 chymotrypsin A-like [Hyla sarda]
MALMAEAAENDGDRQLLHKKSKTKCCSCCVKCCTCCIHCLSGFILLLAIAGLVLCARIFLEFPMIINGFRSTNNFTKETVDALLSESQHSGSPTDPSRETCKMFVGSFQLLNETYLAQYNDASSVDFQRMAKCLETLINTRLKRSLLNVGYRNASVFLLSSNPTTTHFQLLFCNDNATISGIKADNIVQGLRNYSASKDIVNISMNLDSLAVGGVAPCPVFFNSSEPWPWSVVLQQNQITLCAGSLLSGSWVLSSATCVKNRDPSLLTIMLEDGHSSLRIDMIFLHPNFTASSTLNNFALIRLSTPVWFSSSIIPICLSQTSQDPTTGSLCSTLVGNASTGGLTSLAGTVTTGLTCLSKTESGSLYLKASLSNTLFNQTNTGDPLVCMNTDGTAYLQGISSSLSSSVCLSFTSIGQTVSWINSYILN